MIEKLDQYHTSSIHTVIDKINEIIDFLNDTNAMRIKDGHPLSVTGGYVEWPAVNNIVAAIDEIKLLENIIDADKYSDSVYNSFRKEVCAGCRNADRCLQSKMAIVECPKFENYYAV